MKFSESRTRLNTEVYMILQEADCQADAEVLAWRAIRIGGILSGVPESKLPPVRYRSAYSRDAAELEQRYVGRLS